MKKDAKSNSESNAMDRLDSTIPDDMIDFESLPPNLVDHYTKEGNKMDIVDSVSIIEERGIEMRQQLENYLDLGKQCITDKGEDSLHN